jgi:two-component system chemotaxis response regulator CheY
MRALVVDDSPVLRSLIRDVLVAKGYEVLEATDGVDAIAKIEAFGPDLLVTDLSMPYMNGIQLVAAVRTHPRFERMPVLVVTSEAAEAVPEASFDAGANSFLEKPFSLDSLEAAIDRLMIPRRNDVED